MGFASSSAQICMLTLYSENLAFHTLKHFGNFYFCLFYSCQPFARQKMPSTTQLLARVHCLPPFKINTLCAFLCHKCANFSKLTEGCLICSNKEHIICFFFLKFEQIFRSPRVKWRYFCCACYHMVHWLLSDLKRLINLSPYSKAIVLNHISPECEIFLCLQVTAANTPIALLAH